MKSCQDLSRTHLARIAHITFALLLIAETLLAADGPPAQRSGVTHVTVVTQARFRYLAITPSAFRSQRLWPLIVFLHGSDQRGTDLNVLKTSGPTKYALNHPGFPFVVVAPQLLPGKIWNGDAVAAFSKQVISRYRVDRTRIYLTGLSTGGYGVWSAALLHPDRFAAIAPVAGGGNTVVLKHAEGSQLSALQSLGVWAFHGGSDSIVDPSESQRMISEMQKIGASDARLTIFPGASHDIWNQVYDDPAIYDWFLQHHR